MVMLTLPSFLVPSTGMYPVRRFCPLSLPICRSNYALHDPFRVLCDDNNALCHILLFDSPNATSYEKLRNFLSSKMFQIYMLLTILGEHVF